MRIKKKYYNIPEMNIFKYHTLLMSDHASTTLARWFTTNQ